MLAGALLCPVACIAVFNPPPLAPGPALYAAVLAALLLYCTAYSLFAIPYMALGAEMTDDYQDRASLMAWRTFFVYASGIAITAGAPALIASLGSDRAAYATMSWAAALIVGTTLLWVVLFTRSARQRPRTESGVPLLQSLRTAAANKPFFVILLVKMTGQLGTAFTGAAMLFFFVEVLGQGEKVMATLGLVVNVVGVASVPLWNLLLHRMERRALLALLLGCSALAYLSWWLASATEPGFVFLLRAFALGACGSGTVLIAMAMLADTIEYDRLTTGERREGLYVGAYELMQTTSFVVAPLLAGFAFSAAGLIPGDAGHGRQPESALQMIRIAMSVLPAACCAIGVLLSLYYPLDRKRLAALRDDATAAV
jgi:GPH family glycoside/pentoside/hexuronide:cation symporter